MPGRRKTTVFRRFFVTSKGLSAANEDHAELIAADMIRRFEIDGYIKRIMAWNGRWTGRRRSSARR
jgi:hypothetical protein